MKVVLEARFQPIHLLVTNSFICTFKPRLLFLIFSVIKKKNQKKTNPNTSINVSWMKIRPHLLIIRVEMQLILKGSQKRFF